MDLGKENMKKIRGLIIFTLLLLILLWKYEVVLNGLNFMVNIIFPFLLGGAIAFIINVPMNFFQRHLFENRTYKDRKVARKLARPVSLILTIIAVVMGLSIVMRVVVPQLGNTILSLGTSVQEFIPKVQDWGENLFHNNKEIVTWINSLQFNWDKMIQSGIDFFKTGAGSVLNSTFAAAKSIVSGVTTFFIAFVFSIYILLQKEKLNVQVKKIAYAFFDEKYVKQCLRVFSLTYKTFSHFLTGQCVEAVILGSMFFVAMSIFRLPYALLIGVLIAFTALIPIFGAFIGCAIGAFLILMVNPMQAIGFIVLFLVLQQLEGNFIYPHVVGGSVGLPSIWVLVAVSIGGSLMGIVGMLIFIPIVSVAYTLFRGYVYERLKRKNVTVDGKSGEVVKEEQSK
ncbi:MAG: AI-2E family transporter [Lachnospiraceae bacterium]